MLRREVFESELDYAPRDKLKATLREIERDPECGKPLGGALKGCRSKRLEGVQNRVVYRVDDSGCETVCEVIAIGRRRASAVYETAKKRI